MKFINLTKESEIYKEQGIVLLQEAFKSYEEEQVAREEIEELLEVNKICIGVVEEDQLIGLIGGMSSYSGNVWELHPLIIKKNKQYKGIGSKLLACFEEEVKKKGGMTIYLGTDDENNLTSLSNQDLYDDLYTRLENVKNKNNHPFTFYLKKGYKIVGVIPDANGYGKPDIMMAKRVGSYINFKNK